MYIILKNKKNIYFWDKLCEKYNIQELYLFNTDSFLYKILKKIGIIVLGNWKRDIGKYEKFIIFESLYNKQISRKIKKNNPNCKIIIYFWNHINNTNKYILKDINVDEFWTFDKEDAIKYQIKYNPQFYTKMVNLNNKKNIINDIVFLGRPKDRKEDILNIASILKKQKLRINFKIIENEKEFIKYDEYLDMISESKCILDYNQDGQIGLTLRPMEALFFEKKLITNNKDIKNYNFYNPNNIFILGEDNIEKIRDFIEKPYIKIKQEIVDYYDFTEWIKRFGVKNEF